MILADKIIQLRKKCGWSQEELAEKMGVSRQAVCKWEGAQSVPDLGKILMLSQLFNVSTDYLLKDDIEDSQSELLTEDSSEQAEGKVRYVSMEEANAFLKVKAETTGKIAAGVFLCIFSPVTLMLLAGAGENNLIPIKEDVAGALGMIILFFMIAVAVAMFIYCGIKTSPYEYLEKEIIETQYGVTGMVKERQKQFRDTYIWCNIIGVLCCLLAVIPLFVVELISTSDFAGIVAVCTTLLLVGTGVVFLIKGGIPWESMNKLLQEGDFTVEEKRKNSIVGPITTVYWLIATAIFVGYGLWSNTWGFAGMFWAVAGILFGAVVTIVRCFDKKGK
ncbi:MAG: helix-turn-helix transcriptional regulator [Agathobacter sp.]|nr:helix-turn-helix transcriptional regulator [Agathobacter sp.]